MIHAVFIYSWTTTEGMRGELEPWMVLWGRLLMCSLADGTLPGGDPPKAWID